MFGIIDYYKFVQLPNKLNIQKTALICFLFKENYGWHFKTKLSSELKEYGVRIFCTIG